MRPKTALGGTRRFLALLTLLIGVQSARAQSNDSFVINSRVLGEPRRINVHVPAEYAPGARLPVLYMPDGGTDEDFPHVTATVDSLVRAKAIRPVIVVGIPNTERRRDLTGPTRVKSDSAIAPRVGGSAQFRAFIKDELFPEIARRYRVSDERSIIGESLAGLFIVETFLLDPTMFTNYVALDASLWWNAGSLVDGAPARIAHLDGKRRSIYLGVSDIKEMGEGITRLDAMLQKASPNNLRMSYLKRLDLTHATIFRALEGPALTFALR